VKLITLRPGDSKIWEIGSVPEVFQSIPKGDLWVKVILVYYYCCHMNPSSPTVHPITSEVDTKTQLTVDLKELLGDGESAFSDFHIKHGAKSFHLHKAILAGMCKNSFVFTF